MELEKPSSELEENACGEAASEPPPSTSSSAVEEEIPTVDRGDGGVEKGGPPLLDPSSASTEGRLCSQDLAGATASPAENPRSESIVTVPVVSVPCILAPVSLAESHESQGFVGQLAMTHQTVLATVTVEKQMEPQTPWPSALNSSTAMLSTFVNPTPLQQVPPPTPKNCYGDAYNWRKYGQKQVKSSENARSYYRCTGSNCSAKKKVVHCPDGAIIEVIYRGKHNHDPPQKHRYIRDRGPQSGEIPLESQNLEKPNTEPGKPDPQSMTEQNLSTETPKQQLYCSSDCEFDAGTKSEEDIYDEPDPKRRLSENSNCSSTPIQKTIREYVVQTEIDARHLNDGYRWRKYGQKFVKGNSNPRSYYRCTHSGCPVRKHVERASHDAKSLLITYEGEHNHPQPSRYTNKSSSTAFKVATAVADEHLGTSPISGKSSSDKSPQNTKAEKATGDSKFELGDGQALESAQTRLNTAVEEAAGDRNLENGGDPAPESAQALLSMEFNSSSGDSSGMNSSEGIKSSMINKTSASVSIHST
ncbi:putative WRKY transcription factor 4 [Curcuma longa]|uniref:putative WRKY transcription factor 4 n=1 Tax=Curcuma longa TaxID=136217 RepID=UPI003D9E85F6